MAPKVFLSHASEDKDRFVVGFAQNLRQNGVDVWLDKWEMLPGDSLVDKIFEEGVKSASAVIIVLSEFSVVKPWVREELNAAFVKRINTGSKLIPVVLDDCEIPEALNSTLWERIKDLSSYQASFDRIVSSIFGTTDRPPLGLPPSYTQSMVHVIGGLTKLDNLVLKLSCESVLESGNELVNPGHVFLKDNQLVIPETELLDSLEMLDRNGYIKLSRTIGAGFPHYQITTYGMDQYARAYIPNYQKLVADVIASIVNKKAEDNHLIQQELGISGVLVDHILDVLENNGHLRQSKMIDGLVRVYNISPALRRSLNG